MDSMKLRGFFLLLVFPVLSARAQTVSPDPSALYEKNKKAIVVVLKYDDQKQWMGRGSGFIVEKNGYILTNYHVMQGAASLKVKRENGEVMDVEGVLFADRSRDLALLKAKGNNLPTVTLGDAYGIREKDPITVIANPQDAKSILTQGVIRGVMEFSRDRMVIQMTAPVGPGCSGGAVFNAKGEAVAAVSGGITGKDIFFAVPVSVIRRNINIQAVQPLRDFRDPAYEAASKTYQVQGIDGALTVEERIVFWRKLSELNPNLPAAWSGLGAARIDNGENEEAVYNLNKAIALDPKFLHAFERRGLAFFNQGKYEEAMGDYSTVIGLDPKNVGAYMQRGYLHFQARRKSEALADWQKAVQLDPTVGKTLKPWMERAR